MTDNDRIPPELDPAYDEWDDDRPSRTFANRYRPVIWVVALIILAGMCLWAVS